MGTFSLFPCRIVILCNFLRLSFHRILQFEPLYDTIKVPKKSTFNATFEVNLYYKLPSKPIPLEIVQALQIEA